MSEKEKKDTERRGMEVEKESERGVVGEMGNAWGGVER